MTDCVYFLLYLALGKLSLMLLINYYYYYIHYGPLLFEHWFNKENCSCKNENSIMDFENFDCSVENSTSL